MLLHTKETAAALHFKAPPHPPPAIPHRQTTVVHRAVPCAADRRRGGDDILLIKKAAPFHCSPQITELWGKKNYTRKRLFGTTHGKIVVTKKGCSNALLELSNKAYSW